MTHAAFNTEPNYRYAVVEGLTVNGSWFINTDDATVKFVTGDILSAMIEFQRNDNVAILPIKDTDNEDH